MEALRLRALRWPTPIIAALNLLIASLGSALLVLVPHRCGAREKVPVTAAAALALARVGFMVGAGIAQGATALAIAGGRDNEDEDFRRVRRVILSLLLLLYCTCSNIDFACLPLLSQYLL